MVLSFIASSVMSESTIILNLRIYMRISWALYIKEGKTSYVRSHIGLERWDQKGHLCCLHVMKSDYEVIFLNMYLQTAHNVFIISVCVWSMTVRECIVLFDCLLCFILMDGALEWQMALQSADVLSHTRGSKDKNTTTLCIRPPASRLLCDWEEGFYIFNYYV